MAGETAVGVDDDLATGEAAVAHRTADDEAAGRVDMELGALVQPLFGQHGQQDLLHHGLAQRLGGDVVRVLGGEHDGIDRDRSVVLVAQRDLTLGIGAQPSELAGLAHFGLTLDETMREGDGGGHQHIGLAGGEAEHQALVAGALLARVLAIDSLCDVA